MGSPSERETELAATKRANELLKVAVPPKGRFGAIVQMAEEGHAIQIACRVLEVSEYGLYAFRSRSPSPRAIRHAWLTDVITQIHLESRGTYGALRVHAELTIGRGITLVDKQKKLVANPDSARAIRRCLVADCVRTASAWPWLALRDHPSAARLPG